VNVWTVDARGVLTPTRQYRKKGAISAAIFCVMSPKIVNTTLPRKNNEIKQTMSPAFFFGTDKGGLVYADDLGNANDNKY
jgi:hypothetical protein